jgi:hypothetical protein
MIIDKQKDNLRIDKDFSFSTTREKRDIVKDYADLGIRVTRTVNHSYHLNDMTNGDF